jgi:hypothetical protein
MIRGDLKFTDWLSTLPCLVSIKVGDVLSQHLIHIVAG